MQVKPPKLTSIVLDSLTQTTCTVKHAVDRCKLSATYMACAAAIQEWVCRFLHQTTCTVKHTCDRCRSGVTYMACTAAVQEQVCILEENHMHSQACCCHEYCMLNVTYIACTAAMQGTMCGSMSGRAFTKPCCSFKQGCLLSQFSQYQSIFDA